jgi:hypothetical protein
MKHLAVGIAVLVAGSLAGTAAAVDGVIELNQTCALQTGCHPQDTPGFPVTIPVGSSYRLTSDLAIGDGNANAVEAIEPGGAPLIVPSNGTIHLDLNGFSIRCYTALLGRCGSGSFGTGVDFGSIRGASVVNGTVRDMGGHGVSLGDGGRAQRLSVIANGAFGVRCVRSCHVSESLIQGNDWGIAVGTHATVIDNLVSDNRDRGIDASFGSTVARNSVHDNGSYGIISNSGATIADNAVSSNGGDGIFAGRGSSVARNTVYDNEGDGILAEPGTGIFQNVVYENAGWGIRATGFLEEPLVAYGQNTLRANNGAGPEVSPGAVQVGPNLCESDTVCP